MSELTLTLKIDPVTGKKTLVADYHSDSDALPNEHEEEHRRLVRKLVEGQALGSGQGGPVEVVREGDVRADVATETEPAQPVPVKQKG